MSKDKVVVFTSSGGFAMQSTHEKKTEKPQYIQATGNIEKNKMITDKNFSETTDLFGLLA